MLTIDVNKIRQSGKTSEGFTLEYLPERQLLELPGANIEGKVTVSVTVTLSAKDAKVKGRVSYKISGECSRCLEKACCDVSEDFEAEYSLTPGAEFPIRAGVIDLTVPVEDAIVTSCPLVILCSEDCKGICFGCGANLNIENCKCKN